MRRITIHVAGVSLLLVPSFVPIGSAGAQTVVGPAPGSVPAGAIQEVQLIGRPRVWGTPQTGGQTVRRYRSYSIDPGGIAEEAAAAPAVGGVQTLSPGVPMVVPSRPSTVSRPAPARPSSGGSKPSFMRADSKARGRFGR